MITSIRSVCAFAVASFVSLNLAACGAAPDEGTNTGDTAAEVTAKGAHFDTFVGVDGKTYFDLVAANGQNVLRSQGYASASSTATGVASVVANGVDPQSFDLLEAKNGEYFFNVVAGNNEIVGTSQTYAAKSDAQQGATAVRTALLSTGARPQEGAAPLAERFETFVGADGKTYFHLRAANGEIVLASQGYTAHASALKGIASVYANGADASNYQFVETNDGQYALRLVAANGEVIARSESYVSKSNAQRAVTRLVQVLAAGAPKAS